MQNNVDLQEFVMQVTCSDSPGLVVHFASFVTHSGGNITDADFHSDATTGIFCARLEWTYPSEHSLNEPQKFSLVEEMLQTHFSTPSLSNLEYLKWSLHNASKPPRVCIWVSKQDHCLVDLLHRRALQELNCEIPLIISNHKKLQKYVESCGIEFYYTPIEADSKLESEEIQLKLMQEFNIELIILGKYMQVLSPHFLSHYSGNIINIHHSFLPAFAGASPYHRAFERGVKLIGATAHYVTQDLDAGPIIAQDIAQVTHHDTEDDLIRKGRDVERMVLARAVRLHLQRRVIVVGNKTVVFL